MPLNTPYIFMPSKQKRGALLECAMSDTFFEPIVHDLIDYGHEITFSPFGGAGAYQPFALATERLDTPEKQSLFSKGFIGQVESGVYKAKISLSLWLGQGGNCHSFFHELMHFYQDMNGLYLLPLKERGVMPVMADMRSTVTSLLFCEAWAQVEALRVCWALKNKGIDEKPWEGALSSSDWGALARFYGDLLDGRTDESVAAARTFEQWYKGKHRRYYERHALKIYEKELARLTHDLDMTSKDSLSITAHLRSVSIPVLLEKLPHGAVPKYFSQVDWDDSSLNEPQCEVVLNRCADAKNCYWSVQNEVALDIKCASPAYLWKRLSVAEVTASEVPPH